MDTLTFINNIVSSLIWPVFLFLLLLHGDRLKQLLETFIETIGKRLKTANLKIMGQEVNLNLADIEKKLETDIRKLRIANETQRPIPYATKEEIDRVVAGIHTLELLDYPMENISDLVLLKCMGSYYYMIYDFDTSLKYFRNADRLIESQSVKEKLELYSSLGYLYVMRKDYLNANKYLTMASSIDNNFAWSDAGLGRIFRQTQPSTNNYESYFQSAIEKFKKGLGKEPLDYYSYFGLGYSYYWLGKLPEAIDYFTQAVQMNPNFALAYYNRAIARLKSAPSTEEQKNEVVKDLKEAIILNPRLKQFATEDEDLVSLRDHCCFQCLVLEKL
jgi:tetratricopeptide (TPR) repeat protein